MILFATRVNIEVLAKVLVLILPLCLFTGNAVVEIIIVAVGILFLIHCSSQNSWSWIKHTWVRVAFLLWLYMIARSIFAEDVLLSLKRGVPWIRFVVFSTAIAYWLTKDKVFLNRFKIVLAGVVTFISCDAIFQYTFGIDFFGRPYNDNGYYIRLLAFSGKMNIGNLLALIALPAMATFYEYRRKLGFIWPILALLPLVGVFLSGERMSLIIISVGMITFIALQKELRVKALLIGVVLCMIAASLVLMNKTQFARQTSAINELTNTNSTYHRIYHVAFDLFLSDPIFGIGLKHYQQKCNDSSYSPAWLDAGADKKYYCQTHPHNIYIEILTETGLIGFALFFSMISLWLYNMWNNRAVIIKDSFTLACMITVLVKYIPVFSSSSYFVAWPVTSTWLFLGMVLSIRKQSKTQDIG